MRTGASRAWMVLNVWSALYASSACFKKAALEGISAESRDMRREKGLQRNDEKDKLLKNRKTRAKDQQERKRA